jgi:hypothetical protein
MRQVEQEKEDLADEEEVASFIASVEDDDDESDEEEDAGPMKAVDLGRKLEDVFRASQDSRKEVDRDIEMAEAETEVLYERDDQAIEVRTRILCYCVVLKSHFR